MRLPTTCLLLALAAAPACKKDKDKTPPAPTEGSSTMAGSSTTAGSGATAGSGTTAGSGDGSAMAGSGATGSGSNAMSSGADASTMSHHAGNCPSTVVGSTTKAELKGGAVVVTISADGKDAQLAIQKRTDELLQDRLGAKAAGAGHDKRGTHGGASGLCPVHVPEGATATAKHDPNGVTVTITPKDKPDELKANIDGRIVKAADWVKANLKPGDKGNQGGTGGGKADEGMNRSGSGDSKGMERKHGDGGSGGGKGTGGGSGKGKGGGGSATPK